MGKLPNYVQYFDSNIVEGVAESWVEMGEAGWRLKWAGWRWWSWVEVGARFGNTRLKTVIFEAGLLWKDELRRLPNNRDLAVTRFKSLEKKFRKNPEFHELYKTQIKEYLELGHAKQLTREESRNASVVTNYIPHHGVMNFHKPGRVRVVFEASAKYQKTSLNENLLSGIDFLNNLVNVITKFWTG